MVADNEKKITSVSDIFDRRVDLGACIATRMLKTIETGLIFYKQGTSRSNSREQDSIFQCATLCCEADCGRLLFGLFFSTISGARKITAAVDQRWTFLAVF